uniref:Transposase-associated domain-containing protein n=1 Tax=Setaria italica TaxID=4555 RepID=K3YLR4_SETIT
MDHRVWMYGIQRHSHTFMSEAAEKHARICKTKQTRCSCFACSHNIVWEDTNVIKRGLIKQGFVDGYTIWSHHGEAGDTLNNTDIDIGSDEVGGGDANENDHVMMDDDYDCGYQNGDPNRCACRTTAKKIINPLNMHVQRIHMCRNQCILYRGEYAALEKCSNCGASRYKSNADFCEDHAGSSIGNKRKKSAKKGVGNQVEDEFCIGTDMMTRRRVPTFVMWNLPVVKRLKRLFSNPKTAEMMTWHAYRLSFQMKKGMYISC